MYISSGETIQVVGTSGGQVLKLHDTHARNGLLYSGRFQSPYFSQMQPDYMKIYGKIFTDVQAAGNYPIRVNIALGRKGLPSPKGTDEVIDELGAADGWGVGEWALALWGGGGIAGKHIRLSKVSRGHYIRVQVETSGSDQWFKVSGLMIPYVLASGGITA